MCTASAYRPLYNRLTAHQSFESSSVTLLRLVSELAGVASLAAAIAEVEARLRSTLQLRLLQKHTLKEKDSSYLPLDKILKYLEMKKLALCILTAAFNVREAYVGSDGDTRNASLSHPRSAGRRGSGFRGVDLGVQESTVFSAFTCAFLPGKANTSRRTATRGHWSCASSGRNGRDGSCLGREFLRSRGIVREVALLAVFALSFLEGEADEWRGLASLSSRGRRKLGRVRRPKLLEHFHHLRRASQLNGRLPTIRFRLPKHPHK